MRPKPVISDTPCKVCGLALLPVLAASAALAADDVTVSDKTLRLWAEHALPLTEFVAEGYALSKPNDAIDPQWCAYQPSTMGLLYAKHANCNALLSEMRQIGRIE